MFPIITLIIGIVYGAAVTLLIVYLNKPSHSNEGQALKCEYCGAASVSK